jgi:lipoate-protein ligase A
MAWRLLDFQNRNIFENMAIDEAIFHETIKNKKHPTIRFYGLIRRQFLSVIFRTQEQK